MEAPLQTEMVELVPNGKHSEGLHPVTTPAAGNQRVEGTRRSSVEGEGFLQKSPSKEPHFTDFEGKTSFGVSVFNLSNAIMGSGILGLAFAMANTGIILFLKPTEMTTRGQPRRPESARLPHLHVTDELPQPGPCGHTCSHLGALFCSQMENTFLLTAVALLSSYSIHLLLKSSGVVGIRAYEQLGYRAFGTPGKLVAALAITLQNIGAMSSYLYIIKSELPLVIQSFLNLEKETSDWYVNGNYLVILVSVTIILPLALMRQLGYLGYSSGFSLSCMVFFLIAVIYKKFHVPCPLPPNFVNITGNISLVEFVREEMQLHRETDAVAFCTPRYFTLNIQTAYTIPIMAFAFVCHPEVLPIYTELKDPSRRKMQRISNLSIAVMYVMYFLAALFGYLTFYDGVESELLHTYSKVDPFDVLILCVRVAVLTAVTLTVPIVLFPVRRAIQQMMFQSQEFSWPQHTLIAIILLTCINLLVIFAPNILGIFGIIGATSAPCLIFIFPAIFYFRIMPTEKEPARSTPKILALCFAVLGFLLMTMSLSFIIIDWVSGTSQHEGSH